jgi:hypothetical protein
VGPQGEDLLPDWLHLGGLRAASWHLTTNVILRVAAMWEKM